jgi:hypothetical protein
MALVRNSYVLDTTDHRRAVAHLDALAAIGRRVPVRPLSIPRGLERVMEAQALVARDSREAAIV